MHRSPGLALHGDRGLTRAPGGNEGAGCASCPVPLRPPVSPGAFAAAGAPVLCALAKHCGEEAQLPLCFFTPVDTLSCIFLFKSVQMPHLISSFRSSVPSEDRPGSPADARHRLQQAKAGPPGAACLRRGEPWCPACRSLGQRTSRRL